MQMPAVTPSRLAGQPTTLTPLFVFVLILISLALALPGSLRAQQAEATEGRFYGAMQTEYPDWFKESFLDFNEDIAEAAAEGRRLLLFIHQNGCPYCNRLVEVNLAQKDIVETMQRHLDVVEMNMWGDRDVVSLGGRSFTEKQFAAALRVQFTPTLIFFDEQGRVALRLNGYVPPQEFRIALDYVTGRMEREITYRDYIAQRAPPAPTGALIAEPFFAPLPYDLTRDAAHQRPVAVFFEQQECPNCDTLHDQVLTDPETRALIARFDAVQLDMWSDTPVTTIDGTATNAAAWADALGIGYAPTIVLFDASGTEVIRSEAFFKVFHTQSIFDYVVSGGYRDQPSFQRFLEARAAHILAQGRDVDIWR